MAGSLKQIAKHSAIYGVADILAKMVGFILLPLYSRKFSIEQYGILGLIQILNTLPGRFINQGIATSSLKAFTVDYAEDEMRRRVALSTAYYYLILSAVVVNTGLCFSIPLLSRWVLKSGGYEVLLICTFLTSICETAQIVPLNVLLRARFRSVFYSTLSFCEFLASVSLNILFIVFLDLGIAGIVYTDLIVGFAVTVISFFIVRSELVPVFSRAEVMRMIRYGWPLTPARISMWLLDFADRFQLQRLSTTIEVGLYVVGAKYAKIFQFIFLTQFEKVWPSVFFPLSREKNASGQFSRLFTYLFLAACSLGIAVILFVEPCIRLTLEPSYYRASRVVGWLVAGFILEVTYQVFTVGLRVKDKTRYMPTIVGAGAAFNVLANLWVLPRYGMVGAGVTTFLANGILVALSFHYANRYYPVPYEWGRLARIGALFTGVAAVDAFLSPANPRLSIPLKLAELAAFALGLWLLGVVSAEEMKSLRGVVRGFTRRTGQILGLEKILSDKDKIE